jgi:hypothetical protein
MEELHPENHIISFPDNVSEECCKLFLNAELIRRK